MTDQTNEVESEAVAPDELALLKARADMLGITYHPKIGVEKLREKIAENLAADSEVPVAAQVASVAPVVASAAATAVVADAPAVATAPAPPVAPSTPAPAPAVPETEGQRKRRLRNEATALVRIRITCMNPAKKEWEGEIFTVGNSNVGTLKKFVPFEAEDGYHVPHMMYQMIKERQCQVFTTIKSKHGVSQRKGKLIREFAIEVLDPLTPEELKELAARQAATRAID